MNLVPSRLAGLPEDRDILPIRSEWIRNVVCHHGMRSMQVAMWLQAQGFDRVSNLDGGIDAWSQQVDPSIPQY